MRRYYLTTLLLVILALPALSQAFEGSTDYNKKKQKALVLETGYPQEAVENAIIEKFKTLGNKSKEEKGMFNRDKGVIVFKNAYITEISDKDMDYIVKIERKSRKEKDMTSLYLIINKNGEDMLSSSDQYVHSAKSFLNTLLPEIEVANLDLKIKDQETEVGKSEKKFKDLQADKESMEKKIKQLQEDIKTNAKDQEEQQKQMENQKQLLELLRGKKKV
jgi:hypothetical protein